MSMHMMSSNFPSWVESPVRQVTEGGGGGVDTEYYYVCVDGCGWVVWQIPHVTD